MNRLPFAFAIKFIGEEDYEQRLLSLKLLLNKYYKKVKKKKTHVIRRLFLSHAKWNQKNLYHYPISAIFAALSQFKRNLSPFSYNIYIVVITCHLFLSLSILMLIHLWEKQKFNSRQWLILGG